MQELTPLMFLLLAIAAPAQDAWQHCRLEGQVLDPTCRPVVNAEVVVEHDGLPVARAHSDGAGSFVLPRVPAEFVVVRVYADGPDGPDVGGALIDLWGEGRGFARVRTMPARRLSGVVRDDTGEAVAGAWVTATSHHVDLHALCSARSGVDGRYVLTHVPVGPVQVRAWTARHDAEAFAAMVDGPKDTTLDCTVERDFAEVVTFQLEDATDEQRARARLRVVAFWNRAPIALPPGLARPRPVAPGRWEVRGWTREDTLCAWVELDGAVMWPSEHTVDAGIGTTRRRFLVNDPDGPLRGRLTWPDGTPAGGVPLMVQPPADPTAINCQRRVAVTRPDGTFLCQCPVNGDEPFALRSLSPTVVVAGNDANPVWFVANHFRDQRWDLEAAPADTLHLRLRDARGAPAAGVGTQIWRLAANGDRELCLAGGCSGLDGSLHCPSLRLLPPLRVAVLAFGPDGTAAEVRRIGGHGEIPLEPVALRDACTLAGSVIDGDGEPVPGAVVQVLGPRLDGGHMIAVAADRRGRFLLRGLESGQHHYWPPSRDPQVSVRAVRVLLEPGLNEVTVEIQS